MNIMILTDVEKSYGTRLLFHHVSGTIHSDHRIGLIGVNGTGKSTLLKVLDGSTDVDKGKIERNGKARIYRLEQDPLIDKTKSILENVLLGDHPKLDLVRDFEKALSNPESPEYMKLLNRMDMEDGWTVEQDAKLILNRLGFAHIYEKADHLSGGQRRRLALARALVYPCDLLLLDEPTNHLDEASIDWLETYLKDRKGALMLSTHDRYFLDAVCNTIWELSNRCIYEFQETYEEYVSLKAEREAQLDAIEEKRRKLIHSELQWVRRGAKARTTKQKARLQRFEALQAMEKRQKVGTMDPIALASRLGNTIFNIEEMSFSYDNDKPIIKDLTYHFVKHDRIGIVGPNGIGKSTLMKLFQGELEPTEGTMGRGETVKVGYFSQQLPEFKPQQRVLDYIRENRSYLHLHDGTSISAGQLLERFLFPPTHHGLPIEKLSGGEKRRLFLLRILMDGPNVLLLDEPTNDLDIPTLEVLEEFLDSFGGVLITVCHDRYFLDRVVDKLFIFTGQGQVHIHHGSYSDYEEPIKSGESHRLRNSSAVHKEKQALLQAVEDREKSSSSERNHQSESTKVGTVQKKLSRQELDELEQLEYKIAELEGLLKAYDAMISQSGDNYGTIERTLEERKRTEEELDTISQRWMELEERRCI